MVNAPAGGSSKVDAKKVMAKGMQEKSAEFKDAGSEIYAKI